MTDSDVKRVRLKVGASLGSRRGFRERGPTLGNHSGSDKLQRPWKTLRSTESPMPSTRQRVTSALVGAASALRAAPRASSMRTWRMTFLISGSDGHATESAVISRPSSRNIIIVTFC